MAKSATGKWPRGQFAITCRTCDDKFKFSIYYGESNIWGNQSADQMARWAFHEGHDVQVVYEFYDGHRLGASG